ncbi:MAG: B12-binding domain-containing radical SAM protein [Nitrospirae bacterium]|nr:B12-binding domain-containing radical SAM protein [Nitrospirota bacterium]
MQNVQNKKPVTTFISLGDIRAAGIRAISAVLRDKGWDSNIVTYKLGYSKDDIPTASEEDLLVRLLKDLNTDIAAVSVKTPFLKTAEKITRRIKDELGITVVWGGSHPTIMPEESLSCADVVCVGEGEYPFLELLERTANGESIYDIKNLWHRRNGELVRNSIRPLLQTKDLDALPFPDCGGENKYVINNERLTRGDCLNTVFEYYPMASRGCPYSCSFCINGVLRDIYRGSGPFVRLRSPEKVVDEIAGILEIFPSVRRIRFQDEVFPWRMDWIQKFGEEYKTRIGLPFLCTSHPSAIREGVIKILKKAGLIVVGFGMQSPSERVRKEVFHRAETNDTILKSIEILHRNRLEGFYDIILDNPFETEPDKKEGLDFLLKIPKPYNISAFGLKFFPTYKITLEGLDKGLTSETEVKSLGSQGYFEMSYNWYTPRRREDVFWNCLYLLAARSAVPAFLVRAISKAQPLKKHPQLLVWTVKLSWLPELLIIGARRLARGQLNPVNLLKVGVSRILKRTI